MSKIRKAVITAAGRGTRQFPATKTVQKELFGLVDPTGYTKPVLQIIAEECFASGIEEVCIIVNPTNRPDIQAHFSPLTEGERKALGSKEWALKLADELSEMSKHITLVAQEVQDGFGHAVFQAREWVGGEPFMLMLGDHLYLQAKGYPRCAKQVLDVYDKYEAPVSALAITHDADVPRLGIVTGSQMPDTGGEIYKITGMVEKPTLEEARANLHVEGMAPGDWLSHFGMHVFPAAIFDKLQYCIDHDIRVKNEIQLTSGMDMLIKESPLYIGNFVHGHHFDMGVPEGLIQTQVALAMASPLAENVPLGLDEVKRLGIGG